MNDQGELAPASAWTGDNRTLVDLHDLRYLLYLPVAALVAWFVPERLWDGLCYRAVRLGTRLRIGQGASRLASISALVESGTRMTDAASWSRR